MIINGHKMYRCEISASGKTMEVRDIDDNGFDRLRCVLRLSRHGDLVDNYKAIVARRNAHLRGTDEDERGDLWCHQMQELNDDYNRAVEMLLSHCNVHRWA